MSQLSGGDTDTVIKAAAELLGVEYMDITFEDVFPAKIALYVDWLLLTQERQELIEPIAWSIKRIIAAGVGMRLYIRTYRTYRIDLPVNYGGAIGTRFCYQPVGKDREDVLDLSVAHGGVTVDNVTPLPVGQNRSHMQPVPVAHGSFLPPDLSGGLPDVQRAERGFQRSSGGVYTRVHIKPRRID